MNKNLIIISFLAIISLVLSNCHSLSKKECAVADWKQIGYTDGAKGYSTSRIESHRQSCARVGVSPNLSQYQVGHKQGVKSFCTPAKGFDHGTSGRSYENVCTGKAETRFLELYRLGREIFNLERKLRKVHDDETEAIKEISDKTLSNDARWRLRREIRRLNDEISRIKGRIRDLEYEADLLIARYR